MIDPNEPAYNGDTEPQRGDLSPRQRDIICRLIRDELIAMDLRRHDTTYKALTDDLSGFLRGVKAMFDNDAEIPLLLDARDKLNPRTDEARAVQAAVEHDVATGLGAAVPIVTVNLSVSHLDAAALAAYCVMFNADPSDVDTPEELDAIAMVRAALERTLISREQS